MVEKYVALMREFTKICSGQSRREVGLSSSYYDNYHPVISCQDNTNTSEILTNYHDLTPPPRRTLKPWAAPCCAAILKPREHLHSKSKNTEMATCRQDQGAILLVI